MNRYRLVAIVCAVAGAFGFALELALFNDEDTVASAWRILATSVVALVLLTGLGAAVLDWATRHR